MTIETRELKYDEFYLAEKRGNSTMARKQILYMKGYSGFLLTGTSLHLPGA